MPKSRKESQSLYQQPLKLEWGTPPWATDYEVVDRAILSQFAEERMIHIMVRTPLLNCQSHAKIGTLLETIGR